MNEILSQFVHSVSSELKDTSVWVENPKVCNGKELICCGMGAELGITDSGGRTKTLYFTIEEKYSIRIKQNFYIIRYVNIEDYGVLVPCKISIIESHLPLIKDFLSNKDRFDLYIADISVLNRIPYEFNGVDCQFTINKLMYPKPKFTWRTFLHGRSFSKDESW